MDIINYVFIFIWILLWFFIWFLIWKIIKYKELKNERNISIKKSKSIILWEVYEKVLPFLPNFPYKPRDMIFLWKWVDYIVFDWINDWNVKKIIFLEVKSWTSKLNKNEQMIKNIILKNNIEYKEYRI